MHVSCDLIKFRCYVNDEMSNIISITSSNENISKLRDIKEEIKKCREKQFSNINNCIKNLQDMENLGNITDKKLIKKNMDEFNKQTKILEKVLNNYEMIVHSTLSKSELHKEDKSLSKFYHENYVSGLLKETKNKDPLVKRLFTQSLSN